MRGKRERGRRRRIKFDCEAIKKLIGRYKRENYKCKTVVTQQRNERKKFRKTRERKQKTRKGTKGKRKRGAPADCRKSLVPFKGVSIELARARFQ